MHFRRLFGKAERSLSYLDAVPMLNRLRQFALLNHSPNTLTQPSPIHRACRTRRPRPTVFLYFLLLQMLFSCLSIPNTRPEDFPAQSSISQSRPRKRNNIFDCTVPCQFFVSGRDVEIETTHDEVLGETGVKCLDAFHVEGWVCREVEMEEGV